MTRAISPAAAGHDGPTAVAALPAAQHSDAPAPSVVRPGAAARLLLAVVRWYQRAVSPLLPARCRYLPTCSSYAAEAVALHGAGRGGWLALRRLLRCHPFHAGGHDPVPRPRPSCTTMVAGPPRTTPDPARPGDAPC